MFPEIPADLNALSATELRALASQIRVAFVAATANPALTSDEHATAMQMFATRAKCLELATAKDALAAAAATMSEDEEAEPTPTAPAPGEGTPVPPTPAPAAPGEGVPVPPATPAAGEGEGDGSAGAPVVTLSTTTGQPVQTAPAKTGVKLMDMLQRFDAKPDAAGYASWAELTADIIERADNINPKTDIRHPVGVVRANYGPERQLHDDMALNLQKFERDEMTAALCAPATPYYDMHCMNTTRRPVFNGLSQYQIPAARMKVSIMPSPTLQDITGGYGIWTAENEASTNAVKNACATITCGSPTEYQVYGIYRCITIRNMLAMSYPELVEAWLNRLHAAQSRLAEITLLNAMGTAAGTAIQAPTLGYGASTTIASTLLNYLALFQETQRWDLTENLDIWGHRWILAAMKADLIRRRNTSNQPTAVPTDEDINRMFRNAGYNPHWFIDTPTWAEAVPALQVGNVLSRFPANVNFLIHAPGKFGLMDRGELRIGVTGNNIYRDNNSNSRNEFTMFFESFEGVVDTGECGANLLTIPVCWNGAQIDDVVINCQGGDEVGFQS